MASKTYQSSPAVTYKVCKIQGEIEDFLDSMKTKEKSSLDYAEEIK